MTLHEYQQKAIASAKYPKSLGTFYTILGLSGNAGMLSYQLKNIIHEQYGKFKEKDIEFMKELLGDILWYLSNLANEIGLSLDEIAIKNLQKVE